MVFKPPKAHCPNLNHSKSNPGVRYCPNCGAKFKTSAGGQCNSELHAARRKDRNLFCIDCGKDLHK